MRNENVEQEKDDQEMEKCDGSENQKGSADKDSRINTVAVETSTSFHVSQFSFNENCDKWKEVDVDQCHSEEGI